jgi:spermidine synthase
MPPVWLPLCADVVGRAGLTVVDEKVLHLPADYQGEPGGVTGAVLLAESHLALHTWPERAGVTLDVYVCNFSTDNSGKAEQVLSDLIVAFAPAQQNTNRILRGSADPESGSDELLLEWLNPDSAYGFRAGVASRRCARAISASRSSTPISSASCSAWTGPS